jgi:hypothetical protein
MPVQLERRPTIYDVETPSGHFTWRQAVVAHQRPELNRVDHP